MMKVVCLSDTLFMFQDVIDHNVVFTMNDGVGS